MPLHPAPPAPATAHDTGGARHDPTRRRNLHVAHGRTAAVLLPHVIRHNGTVPAELTGWPTYEHYGHVGVDALPQQALNAYEDQCAPANPPMPMLDDMRGIMRAAHYGRADADEGRTALARGTPTSLK